ncbi:hydrophobic/amphiphilic exporter-1, HAE1 family [Microlunatus sagamiharensis]|uniref:Hydrophobic/amphiphilic exporter-1, HAE1 family n=1 Tax=Microlunatus sagamiharensis TaxID=546874 RepID=A0A1H2M4N7_9ACTN|nr:efflux RND transporter permease subunit [Microlunatus sagamiharensis]SDU88072.1 hydrophobic/amphiphilic exporter-1, HAE1 family [Microlunatus sagamiharensis]
MSRLTRLSLVNRLVVALLSIAVVIFGVVVITTLKQELIPSTQAPQAFVTATYPGSSPQIVADEVADPIEQAVRSVSGVTKVSSTSTTGSSNISVQWDYGQDDNKVVADINNAINAVKSTLPDDVTTNVQTGSSDDIPVLQLAVASDLPLTKLGPLVEDRVVNKLEAVDGVRTVQVTGEDTTRIEVTLKASQLERYDLTAAGVTQTIQGQLTAIPAGTSYDGDSALSVEVGSAPGSVDSVAALPVATADDGTKRLDQIATVKVSAIERTSISRADGRPALGLVVLKSADADSVAVSHAVNDLTPDLARDLGSNASFTTVFDQSPLIEESLHDLAVEGGLGLAFAVVVILVFLLSVRSTIITAISIPLSLLIAMVGLWASDYSLNLFTLAALTVAVGRVVDDSIVVIENIKRRTAYTRRPTMDDIVSAVKEVAGAVTASTLTTVAVFLPVATVSGATGELFRPFAVTVAIALAASLFVALTIVPLLAYWFMRGRRTAAGEGAPVVDEAEEVTRLQRGYLPALLFSLKHPVVVLGIAVVVLLGTVASTAFLKTDFLGSFGDDRALLVTQTLPSGLRLDASAERAAAVETALASNSDVKNYQATVGQPGSPNVVQYFITLNDSVDAAVATDNLRSQLTETPDGGDIVVQPGSAAYSNNDLTVTISGDDEETLRTASDELLTLVKQVPSLTDVSSNLAEERPILRVAIDRRKAADLGFTQAEIGSAVSTALQGAKAGTITLNSDTTDVYVRTHAPDATPKQIAALELPVSQLQQQKAVDKASDALEARSDDLTEQGDALSDRSDALQDRQKDLADRQKAAGEEQQAEANEKAQDGKRDLLDSRDDARSAVSKAKKALADAKKIDVGQPPAYVPPDPTNPAVSAAYLGALQAYQGKVAAKQSAIAQATAGVKQAESGVDQLDEQVKSTNEQLQSSAEQQAQSDEFSNEGDQLSTEGDALQEEQKKLTDEQKDLAEDQKDLQDLKARAITVGDVATVRTEDAPATVRREDGKQAVTITGSPSGTDLGAVNTALQAKVAEFSPPPGVEVVQGGATEDQAKAFSQLGLAMGLAIVLVFIIMVATFRSLVQPLILLVAIPFAATGALAGLLVTGTPLGVPAMIGLLMLIGIVVTNAIVLIDLINTYRERGDTPLQAIIDGARLRLRPIIMTAAATVFALLPMGLGITGQGGGFIGKPLAVVVIGGLVSSTLLTLLLVPVLYGLVARVAGKKARQELAGAPARAADGPAV